MFAEVTVRPAVGCKLRQVMERLGRSARTRRLIAGPVAKLLQ
jgi:hypothetical protein